MTIGERVKKLRKEKGMTQEELAARLGYKSKSSVTHIENGRDIPRSVVVQLADILDTTPAYLMGWEDGSVNQLPNPPAPGEQFQLDNVYFSLAKQAQEDGVNPEDIRIAIETIKAMRNKGGDQNK